MSTLAWPVRHDCRRSFCGPQLQGFAEMNVTWKEVWGAVSVPTVKGKDTIDFLIDASLMMPRYLIRLFENARRRAVTLRKTLIDEEDYAAALNELG